MNKRAKTDQWDLKTTTKALRTKNPIRRIVDKIASAPRKTDKELIPLSLGDPTVYGNLLPPEGLTEAVVRQVRARRCNGYAHSAGVAHVRSSVAKFMSDPGGVATYTADDVVFGSGGSGALEMAITATVDEGDNLLVPAPGFPLYQVIAESNGSFVKPYPLLPDRGWEVDCAALDALVDSKTKAIVVNNPSNPCGSVFSDDNLKAIVAVAEKHQLPIIADEIYGTMTFSGTPFTPIAAVAPNVPVLTVSGMAKMLLVPGWRVGWLCIHDGGRDLAELRSGIMNLSQLILGANTLAQAALEEYLSSGGPPTDGGGGGSGEIASFNREYVRTLESSAHFSVASLSKAHGLKVIEPKGAMYMMVQVLPELFDEAVGDDKDFAQKLLEEESVFVLPGSCFGAPNFFRVVFTAPQEKLGEAYARIAEFCEAHKKTGGGGGGGSGASSSS
mmetsp:Transcript_39685/g.73116  ORF Transcript_39685/g.73116 Transcript_39685/m.73116 type:complete len:444 (+) Transcript_39685:33-1364(+)